MSVNASIFMRRLHYRLGGLGYTGLVLMLVGLTLGCYAVIQHRWIDLTRAQLEQARLHLPTESKTESHLSGGSVSPLKGWSRVDGTANLMAELEQSAQVNGVKIQKVDYATSPISPGTLGALEIKCLLRSTYPHLRAFLAEQLKSHPSMAIEALAISRDSIQSADVEARVTLRAYFADGWGPTLSGRPAQP